MIEIITSISLWELVKHTFIWIRNLKRAKAKRKKESVEALRKVIIAARKTAIYVRQLKDSGTRSHEKESELSILWTELGFALEDLGIRKLAERCKIKGRHWSYPEDFDKDYLMKANVGLEKMEQLATELLSEINK